MLRSIIDKPFIVHNKSRLCQGDILRDFSLYMINSEKAVIEQTFEYLILISQDCDLEQYFKKCNEIQSHSIFNQFLPNILALPAYPAENAREGSHFENMYGYKCDKISTENWNLITQNRSDRYHYIKGNVELQLPNLLIDFKHYVTIPIDYIKQRYNICYLSTINELFRERLSQRFCSYLGRIGLPVI